MSNLIPVSELPSTFNGIISDIPEERVVWNVDLPGHLDQDRILLDINHLHRIQKMSSSALTYIGVDSTASGEVFDSTFQGINMDGTAMMGRVKKVSPADPSTKNIAYEFTHHQINSNYGVFYEGHLLNKASMVDEVVAMRSRKEVSSENAWGVVLDDHIQASLRQSAAEVLLHRRAPNQLFVRNFEYGWLAFVAANIFGDIARDDILAASIMMGVYALSYGTGLHRDGSINKDAFGETLIDKRRWSAFQISQPDRYLAVNALTRVNSLIKVRK